MRKITLIALLLLLLPLTTFAQGKLGGKVQEAKKLYTNLRLSLLNLALGKLSGQYELQLGKSALNLSGNVSFTNNKPGYLLGLGYRYYFSSRGLPLL